ncbi:MAG: HNH endonuclease family protein, partial [Bacteroidota bacterium]
VLHLRTEQKINDDDCLAILDAIFVYVARKSILGIRKSENKDAALFAKYFDELVAATNKRDSMLAICANQTFAMRLPNDNEIRNFLLSEKSNFYNFESGRFLLSLIEESLTKNRPTLTEKILQVEHIMPQTLNDTWKSELGANHKVIYDNYLNNIGNLTLIRHNQELSNHSFRGKKEIYENNAGMQIAKNKIIDQQNWGEEQIKNRAEYLVGILVDKILPISDELKSSNNYSSEKKSIGNRLSFESLGLIGKSIVYFDDASIVAEVIGNKEVKYEDKVWRLSPLTREIETRKNRRNRSGAYWGINRWEYEGRTLEEWMSEVKTNEVEIEEYDTD